MTKLLGLLTICFLTGCAYHGSFVPASSATAPKTPADHFTEDGATIYRTPPSKPYEVLGKYFYSDSTGDVFKNVARIIEQQRADAAIKISAEPITSSNTKTFGSTWYPTDGGLGITTETTRADFYVLWRFEIIRWLPSIAPQK